MRRLALVVLLILGLGAIKAEASHFEPLNLHWARTAASGSDLKQVLVYLQDDAAADQDFLVAWVAGSLSRHPEVSLRKVNKCPAARWCIVVRTANINGGLAAISWGANSHLLTATVTLSDTIPETGLELAKNITWHEIACHAFGGGFTDTYHFLCNIEYRAHHRAALSRVNHNDRG